MLVLIIGTTPAGLPTRHNNYHDLPENRSLIKYCAIILRIETSTKPLEFRQHFLCSIKPASAIPTTTTTKTLNALVTAEERARLSRGKLGLSFPLQQSEHLAPTVRGARARLPSSLCAGGCLGSPCDSGPFPSLSHPPGPSEVPAQGVGSSPELHEAPPS